MRRFLSLTALGFIICLNAANAATWERPAGAYTPTNHSVNTTKYQTDSANHVAISSAKLDGDMNKAFQGLNDIDARTAPSVVGQSGKFLTNNGANSSWGLVSPSSIDSGASAAGLVVKADGSGNAIFGLLDTSSFPNLGVAGTYIAPQITVNSAGQITSASAVSATTFNAIKQEATTSSSGVVLLRSGQVIQSAVNYTASASTITNAVPFDNTKPQASEGVDIVTVTFTPTSASSTLRVTGQLTGTTGSSGAQPLAMLFRDSSADALALAVTTPYTIGAGFTVGVAFDMSASSVSPTTLKLKTGVNAGTVYINSGNNTPLFNGTMKSWIKVEEIQP